MTYSEKIGIRGSFSLSVLEVIILNILWKTKVETVKLVHEEILAAELHDNFPKLTPYTTVMSTMNTLSTRGILKRDSTHHTHYYVPALSREEVKDKMIKAITEALW